MAVVPLLLSPIFHGCAWAGFATVANFMYNDRGDLLQLRYIKKKEVTLGRGFPLAEFNEGLVLLSSDKKELARFKPSADNPVDILGAYPLDSRHVVCNVRTRLDKKHQIDAVIWNTGTNAVTWFANSGTSEYSQIPAVHPRISLILTVPYGRQGLMVHNRISKSTTSIFTEYQITYPRFSPDGSCYAFFAQTLTFTRSMLLVQRTEGGDPTIYEFEKQQSNTIPPSGWSLAWSPSGRFLAGLVLHPDSKHLYIWTPEGKLVASHQLSFNPGLEWAPLWSPDESEVVFFERELMLGEKSKKYIKPFEMHRVHVR